MPRRGRPSSSSRAARNSNLPAGTPALAPPAPVYAAPPAPAPSQQPGLFEQMAATDGGVAVGSANGHTIRHAVTGLFIRGGFNEAAAPVPTQVITQQQYYGE